MATVMMIGATPAHAGSSTILCTGFSGCLSAGRSDGGYGKVIDQNFWSMTSGHNCTNYVAYRLTHGRLVARPPGTGNASTWGPAAKAAGIRVDDVPTVGSVAWWAAGHHGASSAGHVAYVEATLLDGAILVSEDNFNGTFDWRVMSRLSGWPSGFIHYPESDGSPAGTLVSATLPEPGVLDFWGSASDPDAASGDRTYLVTLGGPRGTPGVESFQFPSPYFRFHWTKHVQTQGPTTMYLYALNTAGTAGTDTLLGRRWVAVKAASTVRASLRDRTITHRQHPKVRISLAPTRASGTVDVMRGSRRLARVHVASGQTVTVTLPRQRVGKSTLTVRYRGSSTYLSSRKALSLRVR